MHGYVNNEAFTMKDHLSSPALPRNRQIVLFLVAMAVFALPSYGAWLDYVPITMIQPDGTKLQCYASGDEYHNWLHDQQGYTIVQHPRTGWYVYAQRSGEELAATEMVAGRDTPAGLEPWITLPARRVSEIREKALALMEPAAAAGPPMGNVNNVVIFIRFSDDTLFTDLVSTYNAMFNTTTTGSGSLSDYFKVSSYNQVLITSHFFPTPSGATVASFQDSHPRAYYKPYDSTNNPTGYKSADRTSREQTLLHLALQAVKPQIPAGLNLDANADGRVDNVCFVIKGTNTGWSELLWPHMWSLFSYVDSLGGKRVTNYNFQIQSMMGASVLCHEMGHSLGAPDLYRYNNKKITPVGSWDLMSNNTSPPQQMEVHMKVRYMKWLPALPIIKTPGRYVLNRLTVQTNNGYRIPSPYSTTQYFVVEYRSRKNTIYEQSNEGLLVYRVDSIRSGNANGPPDEIYVYRPGGDTNNTGTLASAAFSAQSGRTAINDWTNPWPFLSNQKAGGLNLSNISAAGDTIAFTLEVPLPARIDSITARGAGDSVAVTWRTDGEYRCLRFEIQRAIVDSTVFQTILTGSRPGAGTTTTMKRYSYGDRGNSGQKYYRIAAVDSSGNTWYTKAVRMTGTTSVEDEILPGTFALEQNYPNPFNPATEVGYQLPAAGRVKLAVYDLLGREVATLVNERKEPGRYSVRFDAGGLPSGAYFYRLEAGGKVAVKKLVLVR